MSYQKQVFQSGQVLLASQLNAMDDQIAANEGAIAANTEAIAANAEAIGQKVSQEQLTERVNDVERIFTEHTTKETTYINENGSDGVILQGNGLIDTNGVFQESAAWICSDYIELKGDVRIKGTFLSMATISAVAFYDSNKAFLSSVHAEQTEYSYTVDMVPPENAVYARFTFVKEANGNQYVTVQETYYESIFDFAEERRSDYQQIVEEAVANAHVNVNGETESTDAWRVSGFVRVNPSDKISLALYGTTGTNLLSFYDKDGKYLEGIPGTESGVHTVENAVPPAQAYYLRYAVLVGDTSQYIRIQSRKIETARSEIERIWAENPLYGKTMAATGDSITATVSNRKYAGYAKIIAERNLMAYETKAIWGATIARGISETSGCILDTIGQMREDADYVILSGGANDFYALSSGRETLGAVSNGYTSELDETTFCGALESMCAQAIERWPGKKLLYVITHRMLDISNESLEDWVTTMIGILRKWGIPYVDLWHEMPSLMLPGLKDRYTSNGNTVYDGTGDGLHPNEEGYRRYYVPVIEARLKGLG